MEFRVGAHMGEKGSKWKEAAAAAQKIYRKRARDLKFRTATARSSRLTTATTAETANSSSNKGGGSIWLRHSLFFPELIVSSES